MNETLKDRFKGLIAFILAMLGALWKAWGVLLKLLLRGRLVGRQRGQDCCIWPPEGMRPRPDPYLYSQEWLYLRGLAYTWDNPDFSLVDPDGNLADRMNLKPGVKYRVVVRVHDGSLLAATNTTVALDVLEFGAGGMVIESLGSLTVDVPAFGATEAVFEWPTPPGGGHSCLRAHLSHPDDGNPLNNMGQHNTEVARPASPMRRSTFIVRNHAPGAREMRLEFDSYRLPAEPMRARSLKERNSIEYLRALRERNSRARSPVSDLLDARLQIGDGSPRRIADVQRSPTFLLAAGEATSITFEAKPAPASGAGQVVNIHTFDGLKLVGGVTIYIDSLEV
jgi:hypothetical protein